MDELDNHPLSVLLLFNQNYFFQFLEWAQQMGWVEAVLFLMEVDVFRFKSDANFRSEEKTNLAQAHRFLTASGDKPSLRRTFPIPPPQLAAARRLVQSKIPLASGLSQVCDSIWKGLLRQGTLLSTTSNTVWPSLRKFLLETYTISMEDVLADDAKRRYFERFLQVDPCDLAALQCFVALQRILQDLAPYEIHPTALTAPSAKAVSYYSEKEESHKEKRHSSILKRWRATTKATLNFSHPLHSQPEASAHVVHATSYSDPHEAFRILLKGSRILQKQYFPVSHLSSSSPNPSSILGLNVMSRARRTSSVSSVSSVASDKPNGGASTAVALLCNGISEHLRMEIAASLALNHAVCAEDIDIIDASYAMASCQILDGHLKQLQDELRTHLSAKFIHFAESNEYIIMNAQDQALHCNEIRTYFDKVELLSDIASSHDEHVHWADPRGRGVTFVKYARAKEDDEDEGGNVRKYMMSSCGSIVAEAGDGGARNVGLEAPHIIAGRLDLCVAEDGAVTRDHAQYMPHKLRLWSTALAADKGRRSQRDDTTVVAANLDGLGLREVDEQDGEDSSGSEYGDDIVVTSCFNAGGGSSVDFDALFKAASPMPASPKARALSMGLVTPSAPSEVCPDDLCLYEHNVVEVEEQVKAQQVSSGAVTFDAHFHSIEEDAPMFSGVGMVIDMLHAVGVAVESHDLHSAGDETWMTMLLPRPTIARHDSDAHTEVERVYRALYPDSVAASIPPLALLVSLKTSPLAKPITLEQARKEVNQEVATPRTPGRSGKGRGASTPYTSLLQVTFSIAVGDATLYARMPGPLACRTRHLRHVHAHLLREMNHHLRSNVHIQTNSLARSADDDRGSGSRSISEVAASHSASMYFFKDIVLRDPYRAVWSSVLAPFMAAEGAALHPVFRQPQSLYDVYVGSHMHGLVLPAELGRLRELPGKPLPEDFAPTLLAAYPLTKLFGPCDFSLCTSLAYLPTALVLHLCFLLLTSHPSVALVSHNSRLLLHLQVLLPRLLHPFDVLSTSCFRAIHSSEDLYEAFGISKRARHVYSGRRGGVGEDPQGLGKSYSRRSSQLVQLDPSAVPGSNPTMVQPGPELASPQPAPQKSQYEPVASTSCRVYLLDAKAYHQVKADLQNAAAQFEDQHRAQTLAFDLDAGLLMDHFLVPPIGEAPPEVAGPSCLDLRDPRLLQAANFAALRILKAQLHDASSFYISTMHALQDNRQLEGAPLRYADAVARVTLYTNCKVELAFHGFWSALLLQALPPALLHFKDFGMVAMDVQAVFAQLLTSNNTSVGRGGNKSVAEVRAMDFESFLAFLNCHSAQAGNSLCHAFYADFLAGMSPLLLNLLRAHGQMLDSWQF